MPRSFVYVDLDGVLADFETAFTTFFKRPRFGGKFVTITDADWAHLKQAWPTFWSDLDLLPHALPLWYGLLPYAPILLTAPPESWSSALVGKRIWARRRLPRYGQSYNGPTPFIGCPAVEKQRYAKQSSGIPNILIDDSDQNIAQWNAAGGYGFQYIDSGRSVADVMTFVRAHMGV